MAGRTKYQWPPSDELAKLVAKHGQPGTAKLLGVPRPTLQSHLAKHDLLTRAEAQPVAVTDPGRIKEDQLTAEIKVLKRENAEYAKALASQEEFFDRIVEATRIPVKPVKYRTARSSSKSRRSVVLPIYDQQFGQLVQASDTPGNRGEFNTRVYDERQARYVDGVVNCLRDYAQSYRLDELVIVLGGDHVEGDEIFAGQPWQLELDPCRQVWELAVKMTPAVRTIVRTARELGAEFVGCYGVVGNHGKVGGKRGGARPKTYSWDWLFEKLLFDRLREEPIDEFAIEPDGLFFYCAGLEFQAIHGENIRGWGGLPFYGLARHDAKSVRLHNRLFRYLLLGHHHQTAEVTTGSGAEAIVSGDWVGANNLSSVITAGSRPQQKILYVAEKWGVTGTERIYLTSAAEAHSPSPIYGRAA